jgi:signal transduction histidine kinase/AraC-like DNA-binding protein
MIKQFLILVFVTILFTEAAAKVDDKKYKFVDVADLKVSIDELMSVEGKMNKSDSVIGFVVANRKLLKDEYPVYLHRLCHKIETFHDTIGLAEIYYRIGVNHRYTHAYDSAKYYYLKSLPFAHKIKDYYKLGRIYNELGVVCRKTDRNEEALNYFVSSINTTKFTNNFYGKAIAENGIGNIYLVQKEYKKALSYFQESLKYGFSSDNKYHLEISYGNVGEAYLYLQEADSANLYINKSMELSKVRGNPIGEGICYQLLGQVQMFQKKYEKAYDFFEKALDLQRAKGDERYLSTILIQHGNVCSKLKRYKEAEKNLLEGRSISKEIHSIDNLMLANQVLYEIYYATGRYHEASDALLLHKNYTDSLYNSESDRVMNDLEFKYQSENKTHQIELLNARNQLIGESKKMQRNQFGILLLLFGGLAAFFYYLYKNKQKVSSELQSINKMKSKFFSSISHEFRTPLTLIKGPVERYLSRPHSKEEEDEMRLILRNSDRLLSLVDQLLNLSKIDAGYFEITAKKGDLSSLLKGISNAFNYQASEKGIDYQLNIDESGIVWFDKNIVEIIITNLLSNAFKFVPRNGNVEMRLNVFEKYCKISVSNSGCNLSSKELSHIFDRFYRAEENEIQGTGIGLSLVKELCILYRVLISATCSKSGVIQFEFALPITKSHFSSEEISHEIMKIEEKHSDQLNLELDTETEKEEELTDLPVLLLVEDNSDMRKYIKTYFAQEYKILEAADGEEGINLAIDFIPDLIISDVMMPKVSGVELCTVLKEDVKTRHIPIILLTAKVGDNNELDGLKSGADDYIVKPFNAEALIVKVERLIATRREMQAKYRKELVINPLNIVFSSEEEKFAKILQEVLEKYLPDPDFTVDQFCELALMSRTQLHRKLKVLTGLSATAFIRTQRIKVAAEMLLKPDVTISDVCFATGFNDSSYFSKCFKEIQGCTPTEYMKKKSTSCV